MDYSLQALVHPFETNSNERYTANMLLLAAAIRLPVMQ
jgi:hypothetical protein